MSDDIVKKYIVPGAWLKRRLPRMLQSLNTLNQKRANGSKRGRIMLTGFSANAIERTDGKPSDWLVTVTLTRAKGVATSLRVAGCGKIPLYRHDDVGKVLKDLTVAHRKRMEVVCE